MGQRQSQTPFSSAFWVQKDFERKKIVGSKKILVTKKFWTCPNLICPDLTCPDSTNPDLTCPDLTCPELTCPDLTCLDLTCPDLTYPDLPEYHSDIPDILKTLSRQSKDTCQTTARHPPDTFHTRGVNMSTSNSRHSALRGRNMTFRVLPTRGTNATCQNLLFRLQ